MSIFSSKAETLNSLRLKKLKSAHILPLVFFSREEWRKRPAAYVDTIEAELGPAPYIVRSSSKAEDQLGQSNAGAFLSLMDVDRDGLPEAIDAVFGSYDETDQESLVLIQPLLREVLLSGVAFSRDPGSGAPYRIISWSTAGDTDVITSGDNGGKTFISHHTMDGQEPEEIAGLAALFDEISHLSNNVPVDIEFAFAKHDGERKLWLLQARPLILNAEDAPVDSHAEELKRIEKYLQINMQPHPFLKGDTTVYSVMADWNPAEIIGLRPRALAKSLYRELIMDNVWAYQRNNYGYRNLRSFPLMVDLGGLPYIDVRVSFNSFIPYDLPDALASKLVNFYLEKLIHQPFLNDKVEFDIVYSCYTLDLDERLKELLDHGFNDEEIGQLKDSLITLTNKILHPDDGLMVSDAKRIGILQERRDAVMASDMPLTHKIYWLIEDCKRYGTLPFAGLARAGFIAVQFLNSLVEIGILSPVEKERFLKSIRTVSSGISIDIATLDRESFLRKYGHLRPGTYDILSPRYDEQPDLYFSNNNQTSDVHEQDVFKVSINQLKAVDRLLMECGLTVNAIELFTFIEDAIILREKAKFEFTKNLSNILSIVGQLGQEHDMDVNTLSYVNIEVLKKLYSAVGDPKIAMLQSVEEGRLDCQREQQIILPPLITNPSEVWQFFLPDVSPNYVTQKVAEGPVVSDTDKDQIEGAIVCIPSADPGYDWLFSYPIAGFITAWGGINSHMAIRASEKGMPAIIGAGEKIFEELKAAQYVRIDRAAKRYEIIR